MRHTLIVAGLGALGLACASPICAAPSHDAAPALTPNEGPRHRELPVEGTITNPDWVARPTGDDMARFYPPLASMIGISGSASLTCLVATSGELTDCRTTRELPPGLGFGAAALGASSLFRMKPQTVDGVPVAGARVNIPIRFLMAPEDRAVGLLPPKISAPTAEAVGLARRLAATLEDSSRIGTLQAMIELARTALRANGEATDVEERAQSMAAEAFRDAYKAASDQIIDARAGALASMFTADEMKSILAFSQSDAGKAWFSGQLQLSLAAASAENEVFGEVKKDAASRFCQQTECPKPPSPAAAAN